MILTADEKLEVISRLTVAMDITEKLIEDTILFSTKLTDTEKLKFLEIVLSVIHQKEALDTKEAVLDTSSKLLEKLYP